MKNDWPLYAWGLCRGMPDKIYCGMRMPVYHTPLFWIGKSECWNFNKYVKIFLFDSVTDFLFRRAVWFWKYKIYLIKSKLLLEALFTHYFEVLRGTYMQYQQLVKFFYYWLGVWWILNSYHVKMKNTF